MIFLPITSKLEIQLFIMEPASSLNKPITNAEKYKPPQEETQMTKK